MFSLVAISALLAAVVSVRADPNPNTPGSNAVYNAGSECPIAWDVDATGEWTKMTIQLMTGANLDMVPLMTVAVVDGTDATKTSYSWTCPEVTPNAAEYFYQFTSPTSKNVLWTTRFTIASDSGATVAAATPTQPGGAPTPWGIGSIVGGASTSAGASASSATSAAVTGSASSAGSSSSSSAAAAPSTSAAAPDTSAPATTASMSTAPAASPSSAPLTLGASSSGFTVSSTSKVGILSTPSASASGNANAAVGAFSVDTRLYQTAVALVIAATGFTVLL